MQTDKQTIQAKPQTSFTELLEGREAIILDLDNLHYYPLNAAAIVLWKQMRSAAGATPEILSIALSRAFQLDPVQAGQDTRTFLGQLAANGLIEYGSVSSETAHQSMADADFEVGAALPPYEPPVLTFANSLTNVVLSTSMVVGPSAIT